MAITDGELDIKVINNSPGVQDPEKIFGVGMLYYRNM
jgi:hypothetical protein